MGKKKSEQQSATRSRNSIPIGEISFAVDIPAPKKTRAGTKYPFYALSKEGMSFFVPCEKDDLKRLAANLRASANKTTKQTGESYLCLPTEPGQAPCGVRCWLLEKKREVGTCEGLAYPCCDSLDTQEQEAPQLEEDRQDADEAAEPGAD